MKVDDALLFGVGVGAIAVGDVDGIGAVDFGAVVSVGDVYSFGYVDTICGVSIGGVDGGGGVDVNEGGNDDRAHLSPRGDIWQSQAQPHNTANLCNVSSSSTVALIVNSSYIITTATILFQNALKYIKMENLGDELFLHVRK